MDYDRKRKVSNVKQWGGRPVQTKVLALNGVHIRRHLHNQFDPFTIDRYRKLHPLFFGRAGRLKDQDVPRSFLPPKNQTGLQSYSTICTVTVGFVVLSKLEAIVSPT